MRPVIAIATLALSLVLAESGVSLAAGTAGADTEASAPIPLPWTARGNEPSWSLTLDAGKMVYRTMDGAEVQAELPKPEPVGGAWIFRTPALTVSVQPTICRDTMTGMPSPTSVSVQVGGDTVTGCGGRPADLLAGEWRVKEIADKPVPEDVIVGLNFDFATGQVSGPSGCNRFFGGFTLSGEGLSFAKEMAGSMMACEPQKTGIEQAFLAALPKVQRFDIAPDGSLLLIASDETILKASREPKK